jgi:uncharacterized protein YdeI (BOF family)
MKKVFLLATAAFLVTGFAFAQDKKCVKGKDGKDCCAKKEAKPAAKSTTAKAAKAAKATTKA